MKLVISHSITKREIKGAFRLCGSKADLQDVANQILAQTEDFNYGWIDIRERPKDKTEPNTQPREWDSEMFVEEQPYAKQRPD